MPLKPIDNLQGRDGWAGARLTKCQIWILREREEVRASVNVPSLLPWRLARHVPVGGFSHAASLGQ